MLVSETGSYFLTDPYLIDSNCAHLNFVYICFADGETIADELNPLTISHTANTISCTASGAIKRPQPTLRDKDGSCGSNTFSKGAAKYNKAPIKPQADNHRGMSFD